MTTQARMPPQVLRPGRWAVAAGLAGFYFVAPYVSRFNPWLMTAGLLYGAAMAGAGYALGRGRLAGHRSTVFLALAALAALPMVAGGRGHSSWVEVAGSMVPPLAMIGAGAGAVLAVAAVVVARRQALAPKAPAPLRPGRVGLFTSLAVLAQMLRDLGRLDIDLVLVAAAVGVAAAAVPVGFRSGRLWLVLVGWITVAAIPATHLQPGYTAYFGFDGPGILFDFVSQWVTRIGALMAAIGIMKFHRRRRRTIDLVMHLGRTRGIPER